jgi:hypothetical protein
MNDRDQVAEVSREIAAAIARRDVNAIRQRLAPGFVHRSLGGDGADAEAFLQAIAQIPGEIRLVRLEQLAVDFSPTGALVTGVQLARVMLDGQLIEDRRAFVDWFVKGEDDGFKRRWTCRIRSRGSDGDAALGERSTGARSVSAVCVPRRPPPPRAPRSDACDANGRGNVSRENPRHRR